MADSNKIHRMRRPSDDAIVHVREEDITSLGKLGYHVPMTAPDDQEGYIPLERMEEAKRAGFRFGHNHKSGDSK
jgi:hypothetical protein